MADEVTRELTGANSLQQNTPVPERSPIENKPELPFDLEMASKLDVTPQVMARLSPKPPRPPRSEKRLSPSLSASPSLNTPQRAYSFAAPNPLAAFEDADENAPKSCMHSPKLNARHCSLYTSPRPPSFGSTRPRSFVRERARSLPQSPSASPARTSNEEADISYTPSKSDAIAQAIALGECDQAREDYERDRRLSSLFKGLGIHHLPSSPSPQASNSPTKRAEDPSANLVIYDPEHVTSPETFFEIRKRDTDRWRFGYADSLGITQQHRQFASSWKGRTQLCQQTQMHAQLEEADYVIDGDEHSTARIPVRAENDGPMKSQLPNDSDRLSVYNKEPAIKNHDGPIKSQLHHNDSDRLSVSTHLSMSHDASQRMSSGMQGSVLESVLSTLEQRQSSSLGHPDQRASFGITDSVLASILASDSFCLPSGMRLSMEQIRSRLSADTVNAAHLSGVKQPLHPQVLQRLSGITQRSEDDSPIDIGKSNIENPHKLSNRAWSQESASPAAYELMGNSRTIAWAGLGDDLLTFSTGGGTADVAELTVGSIYSDESVCQPAFNDDCATVVDFCANLPSPQGTTGNLAPLSPSSPQVQVIDDTEPSLLHTSQIHAQTNDPQVPPIPPNVGNKRTLSSNYFHRFTGGFSGSAPRPPRSGRMRMPSFFGGLGSRMPMPSSDSDSLPSSRAASPNSSIASPLLQNPPSRQRALTGPTQLIDIAKLVTNSPSFSHLPALSPNLQQMGQSPCGLPTCRA